MTGHISYITLKKSLFVTTMRQFVLDLTVSFVVFLKSHENKLTLWSRTLIEKLIIANLVKKLIRFSGNRRYYYCVHKSPPLDHTLS
jgi:hypothetical protein